MSNNGGEDQNVDENTIDLVLSSGLNVKETMEDCEDIDCPLDACSKLLEWSHLYPTSINDGEIAQDIFSLSSLPHLFIVGGLSEFKIKEWRGVKIISVPTFSSTGKIIMLHKNGDCTPLCFKICTSS